MACHIATRRMSVPDLTVVSGKRLGSLLAKASDLHGKRKAAFGPYRVAMPPIMCTPTFRALPRVGDAEGLASNSNAQTGASLTHGAGSRRFF